MGWIRGLLPVLWACRQDRAHGTGEAMLRSREESPGNRL